MISVRACPHCSAENLPHRNYCRRCGTSLQLRCPGCGFTNRCGDQFCGGCGAPLTDLDGAAVSGWQATAAAVAPVAEPDGAGVAWQRIVVTENRAATVVKADLSGFTAMSELLDDPEEVTVIMNQVFEELVACVRRYDGYIDNYAGDMIITFFGAPTACEGAAERAVRVALEMRDEVVALNARNISHGVDLGISTGVASGVGLWGPIGFDDGGRKTLSGELGDWAALLEKYAERGTVSVCPDTYEEVADVFPVEVQTECIHRPGDDTDLPLYFAGDPLPRPAWAAAASAAGGGVLLHGRDDLLDRFVSSWANALRGEGHAVLLVGEAGAGKTRLLHEMARLVHESGHPVYAVGARPLSPALGEEWVEGLREAMLAAAGVPPDNREALETWLDALDLPPEADDPLGWLSAVAQRKPCLVVLDGLDWFVGEPPGELVTALAGSRSLVLMAGRRSLPAAEWLLPPVGVQVVPLPALDEGEAAALVRELLDDPSDETIDWVARWAGGNPGRILAYARCAADGPPDEAGFRPPWQVREQCAVALDELTEEDRAVVYAAAALADDDLLFEADELARVVRGADVRGALGRALANGMMVASGDGRTAFSCRSLWHQANARLVQSVRDELQAALAGGEDD